MELIKFLILITICVKTVYMRHNYNLNSIGNSGLDKINEAKHPFHPTHRHHHLRHGHLQHNASRTYTTVPHTTTTSSTTTIKPTTNRHVVNEDIKNNKENQQDNYPKYANDNTDNDDNDNEEDDDEFDYEYDDEITSTTAAPTTTTTTTTKRPTTTTESPIIKPIKMAYESLRNSNDPNYYYHHNTNHNIIKHYNNYHKNHHRSSTSTIETKSLRPVASHQRNGDSKLAKRYLPHHQQHHNHNQHQHQHQHHHHHQSHEYALQHDEGIRSNENNSTEFINPGDLNDHKIAEYSDRTSVQRNMITYLRGTGQYNAEMKILADQHVRLVKDQGKCDLPKPKLVQVNHDASKQYFPHCTILHVCSNESGCCANDAHICAPKVGSIKEVELHFAVIIMEGRKTVNRYETKTFLNHTQCECILRSGSQENFQNAFYMAEVTSRPRPIIPVQHQSENATRRKRCPRYFAKVVLQPDYDEQERGNSQQEVTCDCTSSNRECKSFKEGFENFSILDRKCIHEGNCLIPICEHGQYDSGTGRCPRS